MTQNTSTTPLLLAALCALMLAACNQTDTTAAAGSTPTTPSGLQTVQLEMIGGSGPSTGCGSEIDPALFADADKLKKLAGTNAGFGLRSTASTAHNNAIDWAENNLKRMPGFKLQSDSYTIDRWEPTPRANGQPGRDLAKAGSIQVRNAAGAAQTLPVAGAVPYSLPNKGQGKTAPLVYIPGNTAITAANAKGKVVVRDVGSLALPYAAFLALAYHITPDLLPRMAGSYDRPYLFTDGPMSEEIVAAGKAGAAGMILVFNLPTEQISGYFDPHRGTHFVLPAVFVGVDEGEQLKKLAREGGSASVGVDAERSMAPTRNLIATLPGQSNERIVISTNTDGNTWVQENSVAGLLALADYLSRRPIECRPKTFEFLFGTAHLHIAKEGTVRYAKKLDKEYSEGTVSFAMVLEHLGTREILPVPRKNGGPGQELEYTGLSEPSAWFVSESPALVASTVQNLQKHGLGQTAVLRGQDVPTTARVPVHCSFGGIGGAFHGYLIPTIATISGPWSLWAPSFGEGAIDFDRMQKQLLASGDMLLGLQNQRREVLAGAVPLLRQLRDSGVPTCDHSLPAEQAPSST
jgi:hypothetical protein